MIVCINVVQLFAKIILTISVPFFEVALIKDFPIFFWLSKNFKGALTLTWLDACGKH